MPTSDPAEWTTRADARPSRVWRVPDTTLRQRLRRLPALVGPFPDFDPGAVPDDPLALFGEWLEGAIAAGVPEPHAMTVATVDPDGQPSSRVVICKDVHDGAWEFATDARSRKAKGGPRAAASFYWQPLGRQVRVTGELVRRDATVCAEDFLQRSPASRAAAMATRPGEPLADRAQMSAALEEAHHLVDAAPGTVLDTWVVYALVADEVEFWQGDPGRAHVRVVYRRDGRVWSHGLVWP